MTSKSTDSIEEPSETILLNCNIFKILYLCLYICGFLTFEQRSFLLHSIVVNEEVYKLLNVLRMSDCSCSSINETSISTSLPRVRECHRWRGGTISEMKYGKKWHSHCKHSCCKYTTTMVAYAILGRNQALWTLQHGSLFLTPD